MKSEISSIIFDRFYIELRDVFFEEFISYSIKKESKEIWRECYPKGHSKADINIAFDLFETTNPLYFHRKYDEEAKQHLVVGYPSYPITVDQDPMRLALKFLLFGYESKFTNNFPASILKAYEGMEVESRYGFLLDLFIKKAFPRGVEVEIEKVQKAHKTGAENEEVFLTSLVLKKEFFKPVFLKTLVKKYFEAITQKMYLKAWDSLSPEFHQNSIWDSSFQNFCRTYNDVSSIGNIEPIRFSLFRYNYQTASCFVYYYEEGTFSNVPWTLHKLDEKRKNQIIKGGFALNSESAKLLGAYLYKAFCRKLNHNWVRPTVAKDLATFNEADLKNADFLKVFSLFNSLRFRLDNKKTKYYQAYFMSEFTFMCIGGHWKINKIMSKSTIEFDPSKFKKIQ